MQNNLLPPRIVIVQNLVLNEPILSHIQNIVGPEIVQVSKIWLAALWRFDSQESVRQNNRQWAGMKNQPCSVS